MTARVAPHCCATSRPGSRQSAPKRRFTDRLPGAKADGMTEPRPRTRRTKAPPAEPAEPAATADAQPKPPPSKPAPSKTAPSKPEPTRPRAKAPTPQRPRRPRPKTSATASTSDRERAPGTRRIWISGATGFVGKAVVRVLRTRGDEV